MSSLRRRDRDGPDAAAHLRPQPFAPTAASPSYLTSLIGRERVGGSMYLAARATPELTFDFPGRHALAVALAAAGLVVIPAGIVGIRRARTTIDPMRLEPTALVATATYRYSRNPIYFGVLLGLAAWAVELAHPLALLGIPLFISYMNRFQIRPEERALREHFSRGFEEYAAHTRRWI